MKEKLLNMIIAIIVNVCYIICFGSILIYAFSIIGNNKLSGLLYLIAWFVVIGVFVNKYENHQEKIQGILYNAKKVYMLDYKKLSNIKDICLNKDGGFTVYLFNNSQKKFPNGIPPLTQEELMKLDKEIN